MPVLVGTGQYIGNSLKIGLNSNVPVSTLPEVVENSVNQQQQQQQPHGVYTLQEEPEDRDVDDI